MAHTQNIKEDGKCCTLLIKCLLMPAQCPQTAANVVAVDCNVWMALTQNIKAYGKCCALLIKCLLMPAQCPQSESNT